MHGLSGKDRQINTFILTLSALPGVGARTVQRVLVDHQADIENADILDAEFARTKLNEASISNALDKEGVFWDELETDADGIIERANAKEVSVINPLMDEYPRRLLLNKRFPPILYCRGDVSLLNCEKAVAIIGTRKPTERGEGWGRRLAELFVQDGYVIVSGLALGCDTIGHVGALEAGGKTIALLPTPIDEPVYPKQNQGLADEMVNSGSLLVSEYAPGTKLYGRQLTNNLVARDEWQPGLSDGVVAIETSTTGGTNHALDHAIKTDTPIAVLDYSDMSSVDFFGDERFGGNVKRLRDGAFPIRDTETVDAFKAAMTKYRGGPDEEQLGLGI